MNTEDARKSMVLVLAPILKEIARSSSMRIPDQDREDAIQSGLLGALCGLERWKPESGWGQLEWCKRYAIREMLRERDRLSSRGGSVSLDSLETEDGLAVEDAIIVDGDELLAREHTGEALLAAVDGLAWKHRTMAMGIMAGYSVSEIGRKLRISQSSADRLYQQMVAALRSSLGNSDGFLAL